VRSRTAGSLTGFWQSLIRVTSRLARSTRDLLNILGAVADKGAGFKSLRDSWADTTTAHGRLVLTVLGCVAEFERELISTRTGEGRQSHSTISRLR
jgi:DNA invertase Pin-like site-specific DNA recombinase